MARLPLFAVMGRAMAERVSIFERRWTDGDGRELARQLVAGKVHPDSVDAMMDMGFYTGWHIGLIRELVRLGQRKPRAPNQ